jgi:hypothetical protein
MQQLFTKEFMLANAGCYVDEDDTSKLMACSFMQKEAITLSDILHSKIPLKDKYWFVCRKLATKEQNQQIAITVAEIVLPIFEKRYPDDKRPREAIDSAKSFIAGHISLEELERKRKAAYDAYAAAAAAAYAAVAAAAAAAVAATADAAAYADAAAADAATADAADAAAADAADAAAYAATADAAYAAAADAAYAAAVAAAAAYADAAAAAAAAAYADAYAAAYAAAVLYKQQLQDYLLTFIQ